MGIEPLELASLCARTVDAKKAENIIVLHVAPLTTIADYFVIATGLNPRQLRAMSVEIQQGVKGLGIGVRGDEGTPESGWILVDLGDVIIHLFAPPTRALYELEVLWGDAAVVDWAAQPKPDKDGSQ